MPGQVKEPCKLRSRWKMQTACSFILNVAWAEWSFVVTERICKRLFLLLEEKGRWTWSVWLWVKEQRREWVELSAKRRGIEFRKVCVESDLFWREVRRVRKAGRRVEKERTLWVAKWRVRQEKQMFPNAELRAQARGGRPLQAHKRGCETLGAALTLSCWPLLKEGFSL